ncbi:MAG TPA: glycosyltransferase [Acidimicrobiia bacterium]|nr:glycosyltransferase [Acidimicrobiia bacterium]
MISVVIPAHNEAGVIRRCLTTLLDGVEPGALDVVVACNGCSDDTAAIARSIDPTVRVVETDVASKAAGLNLGDEAARAFPRVYLDADVELAGRDIVTLAAALAGPDAPMAVAPELHVDTTRCTRPVAAYYEVWTSLPYVRGDWVGAGVYALSEAGRRRFAEFPPIIGDDYFISRRFDGPGEQRRVRGISFTLRPPTSTAELVRVLRRRRAGHLEHAAHMSTGDAPGRKEHHGRALARLARDPRRWPALAVYATITAAGIVTGWWKARFGDLTTWERDSSSR